VAHGMGSVWRRKAEGLLLGKRAVKRRFGIDIFIY